MFDGNLGVRLSSLVVRGDGGGGLWGPWHLLVFKVFPSLLYFFYRKKHLFIIKLEQLSHLDIFFLKKIVLNLFKIVNNDQYINFFFFYYSYTIYLCLIFFFSFITLIPCVCQIGYYLDFFFAIFILIFMVPSLVVCLLAPTIWTNANIWKECQMIEVNNYPS